jgi:SAM-dependent methyltransferase
MYHHLEATLHDLFWNAEGPSAELPLLERFLNTYSGTALELGCGSGRLLLPLARKGFFLEGLDNSEDMLGLCRQQPGGEDIVLHHGDMADFQTGAKYGAITIPAFTLQLLPIEKIPEVLDAVARHLHPGGGLYLTTFIPWAEITGELEENIWFLDQETPMPDGNTARCHTRFSIQRLSQQLTREHRYEIVSPKGKVLESSESTHQITWFWPRELTMILHHAGFEVKQLITDFDADAPFDDDGQILTLLATHGEEPEEIEETSSTLSP